MFQVVGRCLLILPLFLCCGAQGSLDFLVNSNDSNITLSVSTSGLNSVQSDSGGMDFHDPEDFKRPPYLFLQGSEIIIDFLNEWLLQRALEQTVMAEDKAFVPITLGTGNKPSSEVSDGLIHSGVDSGSKEPQGVRGSSGSSGSDEELPDGRSQQEGDQRNKEDDSDSVLEGITTPLLQRLLALDISAFETWQNLLARRRTDPNFQFPELAPTFDALEKKLNDLIHSNKTSHDERLVFKLALIDISCLRLGGFRYQDAVLLSRKLVYLIDFYYYVRLFRQHLDLSNLGSYIENVYFFLSPEHGVYQGDAFPHAAPWNAIVVRESLEITPAGSDDGDDSVQENRVYGIRAYPAGMGMFSLYTANLEALIHTSWRDSPTRLLDNPNAIALPLTDPLTERAFIRLSRFTVFPVAVSTVAVVDADSELMTSGTFHEHDYEHLQNLLSQLDIQQLQSSFSAINEAIKHFEREVSRLSDSLNKRLAVVIVFHFLHEIYGNPAYRLSELNREELLTRLQSVGGVQWENRNGYYLDLEKTDIPEKVYEEVIFLILRVFSQAF
jgi:hypothetical protein